MSFGKILKIERIKKDITATELAGKAGISRQYLSDIENDKTNPSLKVLLSLDGALEGAKLYEKYKETIK